jgi:PKHD-type hydroxylase
MFLQIDDLLTAEQVETVSKLAAQAKFIDGRISNPHNTAKMNATGDPSDSMAQKASQIALTALTSHREFTDFVMPRRIATPTLCRYGVGMRYGTHVDAAFLPVGAEPLRSDVSCTIFISDTADYAGGELMSYIGTEEIRIKGKAGSAIFYPSTTLHAVAPVMAGERLVLLTFIESQVPDQNHRDLIYAINEVRALEGLKMDWRNHVRLGYAIENLKRMWSR